MYSDSDTKHLLIYSSCSVQYTTTQKFGVGLILKFIMLTKGVFIGSKIHYNFNIVKYNYNFK